ncbi:hypothetical protein GCM10010413_13200 [Promicromonospora sukumoe]
MVPLSWAPPSCALLGGDPGSPWESIREPTVLLWADIVDSAQHTSETKSHIGPPRPLQSAWNREVRVYPVITPGNSLGSGLMTG